MKKINLLYLLAILAIISGLLLYYLPDMTSGHNAESNQTSQTFKEKTIVHDFGTTELKKLQNVSLSSTTSMVKSWIL